ncbi:MAG: glycosyltransferase, partial [Pseudanabaena sp.]
MKIAIHNSFAEKPCAETELSRRISIASKNLGWETIETSSPHAIKEFNPDFVLVMHFNTPKLYEFPTYGCMWNPPIFFDLYEELLKEMRSYSREKKDIVKYANIFTYDGYLSSSQIVDNWLHEKLDNTTKLFWIAPFFTSTNQTRYIPPNIQDPHLAYIGINWDGARFKELFKQLDDQNFMEVYGLASKWRYLKKSYKMSLPFDGVSVLNTLRDAGVGLCLHKPEHCEAETPSMRIFEIIASGAIAICGEHKFIRTAFGDNVLYIDTNASITDQVKQISDHIDWIKNNQEKALEMSRIAHDIFSEKYTLEKLLLGIIPYHQSLIKDKGFVKYNNNQTANKKVDVILRIHEGNLNKIRHCLDSIISQTHLNTSVILVKNKEVDGLSNLLKEYTSIVDIKIVNSKYLGSISTQINDGLHNINSDYFTVLSENDVIHPNHLYLLVSLLEKHKFSHVAYSGSIVNLENLDIPIHLSKDLACFEDFKINKIAQFKNFIAPNSFIARSSLASDIYVEELKLPFAENFYLILRLCQKSIFIFSYEVTCEFSYKNKSNKSKDIYSFDRNVLTYGIPGQITDRDINKFDKILSDIF